MAKALVAAEADGLKGHGMSRLPSYCRQSSSGKVNGQVRPEMVQVADAAVCRALPSGLPVSIDCWLTCGVSILKNWRLNTIVDIVEEPALLLL